MNFAEIETMWRSPQNQPSPSELARQKDVLVAELRRRHRGLLIFLTLVTGALLVFTVRFALHWISPAPGSNPFDPAREWGAFVFLLLPWIVPFVMMRQYRRHRARVAHFQRSIPESVQALLDENRMSRSRLKLVGALHVAMLLLLPLVVYQLRAVGKAGDEILVPAFVLWPILALAIGFSLWGHDRRKLRPEKRRLEALLREHASST